MQNIIDFFRPKNHFQALITPQLISNHKQISASLLEEIERNPKQFIKYINHHYNHSLHQIQKMSLVHLVILHSSNFYELFEELQLNTHSQDSWINEHFLSPYQNFLRKLILSGEQYEKVRMINEGWNADLIPMNNYSYKQRMRQNPKEYFNLQLLCYCVNMLNELFVFLKKIPTLGRYYPRRLTDNYQYFVYIASYQTTLLYFSLKFIISQFLTHHTVYLLNKEEEVFFKEIVSEHLQKINEEMKVLFLNKYYNPIQRGIKIGLFQVDRQIEQNLEALYELQILTRQNKPKISKNRCFLGKKIFGDKKFDSNTFENSIWLIDSEAYTKHDLEQIYNKQNVINMNNTMMEGIKQISKRGKQSGAQNSILFP